MHAEKERLRRQTCIGCGGPLDSNYDCPRCDERAAMLIATSHWPLEVALSPRALSAIETGIRIMIETGIRIVIERAPSGDDPDQRILMELANCASNIRSHLQHVEDELRARKRKRKAAEPKDPLLL